MLETGIEAARAALVGTYLKQLKLPTIAKGYAQLAREARQADKSHEEFLLALLQAEIAQREVSRQKLRLAQARFPVLKTLESFQFEAVPSLNKAEALKCQGSRSARPGTRWPARGLAVLAPG